MNRTITLIALVILTALPLAAALATSTLADDNTPSTRDVTFAGGTDGVTLAGTLTIPGNATPEQPAAGVVLVTGSGPQDRDETIAGRKPFAVLADDLAAQGLVVLRYDDRGTQALGIGASTGNFAGSTTRDFADDASEAARFLAEQPEVDPARIIVVGHSTGGIVAAKLAAEDNAIAAVVTLGSPAVPGADVLTEQSRSLLTATRDVGGAPIPDAQIDETVQIQRALMAAATSDDDDALRAAAEDTVREVLRSSNTDADSLPPGTFDALVERTLAQFEDPWMAYFLRYDPADALRESRVPVLAVLGGRDVQATVQQNAAPTANALDAAAHPESRLVVLPMRNHLFQIAETGLPDEYATLNDEMAGIGELIAQWLNPWLGS